MKYRKSLVALSTAMLLWVPYSFATLVGHHDGDRAKPDASASQGASPAPQSIASNVGLVIGSSFLSASLERGESLSLNISDDVAAKHSGQGNGRLSDTVHSQALPTTASEPKTYAMLMAGLGLMGFVVKRRKREY